MEVTRTLNGLKRIWMRMLWRSVDTDETEDIRGEFIGSGFKIMGKLRIFCRMISLGVG